MNSMRRVRPGLLVIIVMSLASAQTPQPQPTALVIGSATVGDLKGEVAFRSPQGDPLPSQRGLLLVAESTIETGKGSTLLNLQDGSQVLIKSHSRVVLRAPDAGKGFSLELMIGKLLAKVQKRFGNSPSFRMGTPTAVITVRGTQFTVDVNKKLRTTVDVYDGLVEVAGLWGPERPVLIRPGFWTEVERERVPQQPREIFAPGTRIEHGVGGFDDDGPRGTRTSWSRSSEDGGTFGHLGTEQETEVAGQTQAPPKEPK